MPTFSRNLEKFARLIPRCEHDSLGFAMTSGVPMFAGTMRMTMDHLERAGRLECGDDGGWRHVHDGRGSCPRVRLATGARCIREQLSCIDGELEYPISKPRVANRRTQLLIRRIAGAQEIAVRQ